MPNHSGLYGIVCICMLVNCVGGQNALCFYAIIITDITHNPYIIVMHPTTFHVNVLMYTLLKAPYNSYKTNITRTSCM